MKIKTIARFLVIIGILALLISGCATINSNNNTTPTPRIEVKMTQSAQVQLTLAAKAPTLPPPSTATPSQPTATPTPTLPPMKVYTHPSNSFSISVPVDWTIPKELSGYVFLASPDNNAFVGLYAENTGNVLDADAFTKAINAFEFNTFSPAENYKETSRDVQADKGIAVIVKNLDINAIPIQIATLYQQIGKVLYIEIYYTAVSAASKSGPILTAMKDSFKSNPANAEVLSPFTSSLFTYTVPDNLYRLGIPSLWTKNDVNNQGVVIQYSSPDGAAVVMMVKTDQGKAVTRALADSSALKILKSLGSDTLVSKTETLKNGSIKKIWATKVGGLQGISIYKWSGTTWFMVSWVVNFASGNIYGPVLDQSIATFELPE